MDELAAANQRIDIACGPGTILAASWTIPEWGKVYGRSNDGVVVCGEPDALTLLSWDDVAALEKEAEKEKAETAGAEEA